MLLHTPWGALLEEWRNTFDKLYNPKVGSHDKLFYDNALKYLSEYDNNTPPDNNLDNDINSVITFDKTVKVIRKLKLKKAVGVDFIPNEVIKSPGIYYIVYKLFAAVFDKGIIGGSSSSCRGGPRM